MPPETAAPADAAPQAPPPDRRRAALLATLVAVPVTLVLLLVAAYAQQRGGDPASAPPPAATPTATRALPPVRVAAPPALTAAAQRSCRELIATLPTELGDRPARPVDSPSPYVAAWGEPAVTLRCGVARPPALIRTADVQIINTVAWFPERRGATTAWTVVDRPVYVEVLAPVEDASTSVARLSTAVSRALEAQPVDPVPTD